MPRLLKADKLQFAYAETPVLRDVSIQLGSGTFCALLGPNGAGKSTLMLTLSGQMCPDSGTVEFVGKDVYLNNLEYKRQVGFVHEAPYFYPNLTVEEFLQFVAGAKGVGATQMDADISRLLEQLFLTKARTKLTSELSMGMRKKLAIASALVGSPRVLFLDESLNGVDFESVYHIKQILQEFVERSGLIILSTHVLEVVEKLCDRFLLLHDGNLVSDLTAHQLHETVLKKGGGNLEIYLIQMLK